MLQRKEGGYRFMMSKIRVDYAAEKIILARTFAKNAEKVGSPEYVELQDCREKHPDFTIVYREFKKNSSQEHYAGMTYEYMVDYIIRHEQPEKRDEMLNKLSVLRQDVAGLTKGHRYPIIRSWFLMSYPEITTLGMEKLDTKIAA